MRNYTSIQWMWGSLTRYKKLSTRYVNQKYFTIKILKILTTLDKMTDGNMAIVYSDACYIQKECYLLLNMTTIILHMQRIQPQTSVTPE